MLDDGHFPPKRPPLLSTSPTNNRVLIMRNKTLNALLVCLLSNLPLTAELKMEAGPGYQSGQTGWTEVAAGNSKGQTVAAVAPTQKAKAKNSKPAAPTAPVQLTFHNKP